MDYPAYPVYRESGIEWLGKIPDHWEVRRLKFVAEIQNGRDYKEVESSEGYPVFGSGGVFRFATEYLYDGESVLFGRKGTIDKPLYVNEKFWTVDTMFYSVILEQTHGRFLYFFATTLQFNLLATQTALPSITQTDLGNYLISYPTYQEQQTIAQFLDHKTQQIDQLIAKKQTLIDKLNEQRIALITHAVTKGLNPAATLKDSGVEWLGEIPKHWEVVKLSYRYEVLLGKMLDDKRITGDFLGEYLRNTDVQWGRINDESLPQMDFRPDEYERYSIKKGDLVVCEGGEIGRCAIWERETLCFYQKALHRLRPVDPKNDNARFMFYVLFDAVHQERFINGASKATIAHLPAETFRQYRFAYPPMIEQLEIVEYLDRETARIDRMVELNQQTIDKLKEYRTALITAAVTGKIDLRNWQQETNHANP